MRRISSLLLPIAVAGLVAGCTAAPRSQDAVPRFRAAPAPQVALAAAKRAPAGLKVGVVVTSTSRDGEGAQDLPLAAGARVAEYRLRAARPSSVELVVADDHGTPQGAAEAVAQLTAQHVAGIVYASQGSHLVPGLREAAKSSTAVLLPYARLDVRRAGDNAWTTGPGDVPAVDRLSDVLSAREVRRAVGFAGDDAGATILRRIPGLADRTVVLGRDADAQVAQALAAFAKGGQVDAVVVWAPPALAARVAAAVQRADLQVPVLLSPDALAPAFGEALHAAALDDGLATTDGEFLTVGTGPTDFAHTPGADAFLAALRRAAEDPSTKALLGGQPFGELGAATADTGSHDAVLALVAAAAKAGSADPGRVLDALRTLVVDPAQAGLAGPALDFGNGGTALRDADSVVALQATAQDSGQRVTATEPAPPLTWFPATPAEG